MTLNIPNEIKKELEECKKYGGIDKIPLKKLAKIFLILIFQEVKKKKIALIEDAVIRIKGGKRAKFDFIIRDLSDGVNIGVWVKDWKRPVGSNVITHFQYLINNSNLNGGIIIGSNFSVSASSLAEKSRSLWIFSRGEIVSRIRQLKPEFLAYLEGKS